MRLIDADALKEAVNNKNVVGRFNTIQLIDNAPTITPDMAQVLAYECGKASADRTTGERSGLADIRWTDKVSIDADGNIRDFDGTILYSMRNEYGEEKKND